MQQPHAPDNGDMRPSRISSVESVNRVSPVEEPPAVELDAIEVDLHLVEPGRRERADQQQQRRAFQAHCAEIAHHLARIQGFEDRVDFYRMGVVSRLELITAAALYPELMPKLNGEWEWIAVALADFDDD
jgi:hypothetical protein